MTAGATPPRSINVKLLVSISARTMAAGFGSAESCPDATETGILDKDVANTIIPTMHFRFIGISSGNSVGNRMPPDGFLA
jgi:hypothetical protein